MKKLISIVVSVVMVMALCVNVFAIDAPHDEHIHEECCDAVEEGGGEITPMNVCLAGHWFTYAKYEYHNWLRPRVCQVTKIMYCTWCDQYIEELTSICYLH